MFNIDGVVTVIADGSAIAVNTSAVITQISALYHPDNSPAICGDSTTVYTLDIDGMTIEHTQEWLTSLVLNGGYPSMLPVANSFDRYTSSGVWKNALAVSADGSRAADARAWIAVSWTSADRYAISTELVEGLVKMGQGVNNPVMDSWWLEDRAPISGLKINKQYQPWLASPSNPAIVAAGDIWHSLTRYRFKRFPEGAEGVLT